MVILIVLALTVDLTGRLVADIVAVVTVVPRAQMDLTVVLL